MIGTILVNVDEITLWIYVGIDLGSLDRSFDGFNDRKLGGLFHGESQGSTDGKLLGDDEGIKLVLSCGKVTGNILVNVDGITLGIDVGTDLGSLYGFFDGSNDVNLEGLFHGDSLVSTDGKLIGTDEGIKLGYNDGKVLGNIIVYVYGITLGINVRTELVSLYGSFDGSNDGNIEVPLL